MEVEPVIWWAFLLGGLIGGLARSLIKLRIQMPYIYRDDVTHGLVVVPGFAGEAILGVIAGLVFGGGGAAVFDLPVQTSFDEGGLLRPMALSVPIGIAAAEYLSLRAAQALSEVEDAVIKAAEDAAE